MTELAQLGFRRLIGVHARRKVFFSRSASPTRTLAIAYPHQPSSRLAFHAGFAVSRIGPVTGLPPSAVTLLSSLALHADEATVVLRSEDPSGRIVIALGADLEVRRLVKSEEGPSPALCHEAAMLTRLATQAPDLAPDLESATVFDGRLAVVQHAVRRVSNRPFELGEALEVCIRLAELNLTHGDLAEWNMIRSPDRIVLCDWESSLEVCMVFHDLAHFVVQSGSLLGRWSSKRAISLLFDDDSPGSQYASRLGLRESNRRRAVIQYLESSLVGLEPSARTAIYRRDMLAILRGPDRA